jgi:hypothetical protein
VRRYAIGRAATLRHIVRDEDGVAVAPTGSVSVTVHDDSGATVQTGTAAAVGGSTGEYTFALNSTVRGELGRYEAVWTYTQASVAVTVTRAFEIAGDVLFDVADMRAYDYSFEDTTRFTAEMVRTARDAATERLENAAQVAFTERVRRVTMSGNGRVRMVLPDTEVTVLHEAWVDEVDVTADVLLDPAGVVTLDTGWTEGVQNVELRYTHGIAATPDPVREAAKLLASEYLVKSALPARATSQSTDLGEFRITLANPDAGRDTGIPEVDAVAAKFGRRRPVVG